MVANLSPLRSAAVYYCLTLAMVVLVVLTGGSTAVAMLTPLVATLLLLLVVTREGWSRRGWASLGLHRPSLRSWPLALALPTALIALGGLVAVLVGEARWVLTESAAGRPGWLLPGAFLANVAYASLTVSLTEEIGWRGYLLPRLSSLGDRAALLLSGLLHAAWHLPFILLTDLYHPGGSRLVVVPLFLVTVTCVGVFLGWLRQRTGSVWPAVVAHSANNVAAAWLAAGLTGSDVVLEHVAGETGVVALAGWAVLAAVLLLRHRTARQARPVAPALARTGA